MFNINQNKNVFYTYDRILQNKISRLSPGNLPDIKTHLKFVSQQLELLKFLNKEYSDQSRFMFNEISKQFQSQSEIEIKANNVQKTLLKNFLDTDLKNIIEICILLNKILIAQYDSLRGSKFDEYKSLINQEGAQLKILKDILEKDGALEKKFSEAYNSAKNIDYSKVLANIKHWAGKLMVQRMGVNLDTQDPKKYKFKILSPIGTANIRSSGPLIIASRHFEATIDGATLFNAIPRRTFILCGVDWVQTGKLNSASKMLYAGLGAIKINRQSRPDSDEKIKASPYYADASGKNAIKQTIFLLRSGEAIIIFPEGWANYGRTQGTIIKSNGVLPAQEGFMASVELAQLELTEKIPIVPTGLIINEKEKTVQAVFGEPKFYDINAIDDNPQAKIDKKAYRKSFGESIMNEIKRLSNL